MELFSGDLLEGFALRDSPEFDDWQIGEAHALERELGSALRRLVELPGRRGHWSGRSRSRAAGSSSTRSTSPPTAS